MKQHGKNLSQNISNILSGENIEHCAKSTAFVKRKSLVSGKRFLDLLLSNSTNGSVLSLEDLAREFEMSNGETISKQGLDERFNPQAVSFLKSILTKVLSQQLFNKEENKNKYNFTSCRLRDSTRFGLPDEYSSVYKGHGGCTNTQSLISIQYEFDLLAGEHIDLQLTSGRRNDQRDSNENVDTIEEGQLLIRDLGYVTSTYLKNIVIRNAYFLNRLPPQMNVYKASKKDNLIDFGKVYKKLKKNNLPYMELNVLLGKKMQLPCRLIVSICNEVAAEKRLKRTTKNTKSTGHKVSQETKTKSKLNIYITNAEEDKIIAEDIYQIYSLRWQIELIFKAWKSICKIDKIKHVKIHRFECLLLSGLIWAVLNWKVFQIATVWVTKQNEKATISIWKFFKFIQNQKIYFWDLVKSQMLFDDWLCLVLSMSQKRLLREKRKGQLSYIHKINKLKIA